MGLARLVARHRLHGLLGENAFAVQRAVVGHHAVKEREVIRSGKEAACGHGLPLRAFQRIEQLADGRLHQIILCRIGHVRVRQTLLLRLRGPEGGVAHAQWLEEPLLQKLLVAHAADHFDDAPRSIDACIGVLRLAARLKQQSHLGIAAHALRQRLEVQRGSLHRRFEIQPAGVAEHFTDEDGMPRRHQLGLGGVRAHIHLLAFELRQVLLHRIVHIHLALIHQDHERGGGDGLGLRGDPEHRVRLHGLLGHDVAPPHGLHVEDLIGGRHQHHRASQHMAVHIGLQQRGQFACRCLAIQRGGQEAERDKQAGESAHGVWIHRVGGAADDTALVQPATRQILCDRRHGGPSATDL